MSDNPNPAPDPNPTSDPQPDPQPEPKLTDPAPEPEPKPEPQPEPANDDWRASISDERVREHAKQFSSPAEAAEAAFKHRQKLSNAIVRPGKDATEEDIAAFHKALGVPEKADDYKVNLPDGLPEHLKPADDSEAMKGFRDHAHKNALTQQQFDANVAWYFQSVRSNMEAMDQRFDTAREENLAALQREWGKDFDRNAEYAVRAMTELGGQDLAEFANNVEVDGAKLGDHPVMVKTFARMGRLMAEDNPLIGVPDEQIADLNTQHRELSGKILEARDQGNYNEVKRLTAERDAINAQLGSGRPIVGSSGRTV